MKLNLWSAIRIGMEVLDVIAHIASGQDASGTFTWKGKKYTITLHQD